jgi:hypothetical protein
MTFWVAGAVVVGSAISAHSAGKAADTQAASTQAGIAEQQREYDQNRADTQIYRDYGADALSKLQVGNDTPLDPNSVQLDPGYQFGLKQGQQAIDRMSAASGGRLSGAALKAASQYNTDYANTGYSTAYNRANQARADRLNRLAALAGIGQTAVQQTGAAGANAANQISGMMTAQGNASAAGQIAQGNIWAGAGNQIAELYRRNSSPSYVPPVYDDGYSVGQGSAYNGSRAGL